MNYLRAGVAALLLAVAAPKVGQSGPLPLQNIFTPHFQLHQTALHQSALHHAFYSDLHSFQSPLFLSSHIDHLRDVALLFPALSYVKQAEAASLWEQYQLATNSENKSAFALQIYSLALEDASRERWSPPLPSRIKFSSFEEVRTHLMDALGLLPHPPERATSKELQEQSIIEEAVEGLEGYLGYSPFINSKYQKVTLTIQEYVVHDLLEKRVYHVPYDPSLEIRLITNEVGEPLFEADRAGNLVPFVPFQRYAEKEGGNLSKEKSQGESLSSMTITTPEQFSQAYPRPSGCGGSASGVSLGLALVPLAARRKREE